MNIDFSYYLSIFWRRFHFFAVIAALFTGLGVALAVVLPAEYESKATLLVESPQIPNDLASSTVSRAAAEQMQVIQQRLFSRANMIDTATRLGVFPNQSELSANAIVDAMRSRVSFETDAGRNRATILTVGFQGEDPQVVGRVANDFVTQLLQENVRIRTGLAGGTLEFFEDEVKRLGAELDAQSAEILAFQAANVDALPENREFLIERRINLLDELLDIDIRVEGLQAQKVNAQELFEATGVVDGRAQLSPAESELLRAQRELDDALLVFAPENPRVRLLRARVAQLESRLAASLADTSGEDTGATGARAVLDNQLADLDRRIEENTERREAILEELPRLDENLAQVPANTIVLDNLQRDYNQTQAQYQAAAQRLGTAATGERIELLSKGQRIIVLEQAAVPERPSKPNRRMIAALGLGAGMSVGLGFIVLLELLNRSIRRPIEISDKLGITPFAVLPLVRTDSERRWRKFVTGMVVLGLLVGPILTLYLVHTFVFPLDGFVDQVLRRFGLTMNLE